MCFSGTSGNRLKTTSPGLQEHIPTVRPSAIDRQHALGLKSLERVADPRPRRVNHPHEELSVWDTPRTRGVGRTHSAPGRRSALGRQVSGRDRAVPEFGRSRVWSRLDGETGLLGDVCEPWPAESVRVCVVGVSGRLAVAVRMVWSLPLPADLKTPRLLASAFRFVRPP